jgi:hypothetical protein
MTDQDKTFSASVEDDARRGTQASPAERAAKIALAENALANWDVAVIELRRVHQEARRRYLDMLDRYCVALQGREMAAKHLVAVREFFHA